MRHAWVPSEPLSCLLTLFKGGVHAIFDPPLDTLRLAPRALAKSFRTVLEMIANLLGFGFQL